MEGGITPLMMISKDSPNKKALKLAQELINRGANLDKKCLQGLTALSLCVIHEN